MKYDNMRNELIEYIKGLSDKDYQYACWVKKKCPDNIMNDELDYAIHFLFDDTLLADDPESLIGVILKDSREVDCIKDIVSAINTVFEKYGYDLTDEQYISKNEWQLVLSVSLKALNIFLG